MKKTNDCKIIVHIVDGTPGAKEIHIGFVVDGVYQDTYDVEIPSVFIKSKISEANTCRAIVNYLMKD